MSDLEGIALTEATTFRPVSWSPAWQRGCACTACVATRAAVTDQIYVQLGILSQAEVYFANRVLEVLR